MSWTCGDISDLSLFPSSSGGSVSLLMQAVLSCDGRRTKAWPLVWCDINWHSLIEITADDSAGRAVRQGTAAQHIPEVSRSLTGLSGATTTLCLPGIWGSSSTGPEHFCIFQWENWIHPIDFKSPAFRATQRVLRALIFLGQALMFFLRVDEAAQGVQPWLSATSQDP